jgi:hypothetical protein
MLLKIDCEGCERFLINVPCDLLKKVPHWVLEVHGFQNLLEFFRKFKECGFRIYLISILKMKPDVVATLKVTKGIF